MCFRTFHRDLAGRHLLSTMVLGALFSRLGVVRAGGKDHVLRLDKLNFGEYMHTYIYMFVPVCACACHVTDHVQQHAHVQL